MSTKVKNTLFRFVTMRTPELLEQENINDFFVKHPESYLENFNESTSAFLNSISQLSVNTFRKNELKTLSVSFETSCLKTKQDLFDNSLIIGRMYDFAIWLTKNRTTFSIEELDEKLANPILGIPNPFANQWREISDEKLIILWDNLFYQIISGKSPYMRDLILSILVAHFFLRNKNNFGNDIHALRKLAQARVIIPKILFEKENVADKSEALKEVISNLPLQTKELDKELSVQLAKEKLAKIQANIKDVEKAKRLFDKTTQKAYEEAQKTYNQTIDDMFRNADTVDKVIVDPITHQERTYKEFVGLEIPKFEFEKPVLEFNDFTSKVSLSTMNILEDLDQNEKLENFDVALDILNQKAAEIATYVLENSQLSQKTYLKDGVVLPIADNLTNQTFSVLGLGTSSSQSLRLLFSDSVDNSDIVQADYKIVFNDQSEISETNFVDAIVNNKLSVSIFSEGVDFTGKTSFTLSGSFIKSSGEKIEFSGTCFIAQYNYGLSDEINLFRVVNNSSVTYMVKGNGRFTLVPIEIDDNNGGSNNETNPTGAVIEEYIPSGFGIKRLGIADYRKVEQEICCYVPGEVSHIENVMAREYKEKATRRLRKSDITTTTSSEQETERLTDTSSTDRFEMNQEASSVLSEQNSFGMHGEAHWGLGGKYGGSIAADFANNTSSEESNNQAVNHAKEVTERALDRVVQKVKEERISKIIEEFEENNKHGFDNRKGDKHVSGVYRWVDKIYKNKVVNYGKRLMYEFMLPKPAHFHYLATDKNEKTASGEIIEKPIDPRKRGFEDYSKITENNYNSLASSYGAEVEACPKSSIVVSKAYEYSGKLDNVKAVAEEIAIPEKYKTKEVQYLYSAYSSPETNDNRWKHILIHVGNFSKNIFHNTVQPLADKGFVAIQEFTNKIPVSLSFTNYYVGHIILNIKCELTAEAKKEWQVETFNAIMEAYEERLAEYNAKVTEFTKVENNPLFYREIENTVLR